MIAAGHAEQDRREARRERLEEYHVLLSALRAADPQPLQTFLRQAQEQASDPAPAAPAPTQTPAERYVATLQGLVDDPYMVRATPPRPPETEE